MWEDLILFIAIGFAAQVVDGAVGMAYGLTASSVLLSTGVPPAMTSASVHAAEVFTTGISGISHWKLGNVRWNLVWKLALPGMIGGAIGAYLLTQIPVDIIKPVISVYLIAMGGWILWQALRPRAPADVPPRLVPAIGLGGGFIDAIGGGGWGPVVTTTLLGQGSKARYTIGSVNAAEFFVTLTISITFLSTIGLDLWPIILGLIIGGAMAAPLAALLTKHLPDRTLMLLVGTVIVLLSLRTILNTFT